MGKGNSLRYHDRSDVGRKRSNNQDSFACVPASTPAQYRQRGWLFLVADGMGAHAAGEQASAIAAEQVPILYAKAAGRSPPLALRRSLEEVNESIHATGESSPSLHGMGTTCTTLVILPRGAVLGHVGDSRAYRIRGSTIEQLTRDHSLVWELESAMPAGQAGGIGWPPKNIITRSMGPHAGVEVDIEGPFPVEENDVYLLASDGLVGQVSDEEIGLFASQLDPKDAVDSLVGLTLLRGAPDNVTVIVAKTGPQEVTESRSGDQPWPLTEPDEPSPTAGAIPWRLLACAAVSLFACLAAWGQACPVKMPPDGIFKAAALVATVASLAVALVLLFWAVLLVMGPAESTPIFLQPGQRLGRGPYRRYECSPSESLFEGVFATIEAASDSLPASRRSEVAAELARARREAVEGAHRSALLSAKRAIDVHVQVIRS